VQKVEILVAQVHQAAFALFRFEGRWVMDGTLLESKEQEEGCKESKRSLHKYPVYMATKVTCKYHSLHNKPDLSPVSKPATTAQDPALRITVISAGAGSGKTFTLTGKMVDLLRQGVRANGILATTFTQKAAAELQERVRVRLLESGMTEAANELGAALIGTVHSIGTRMLQRFAFEAGVSPLVEIIAENDGQRLFNESLSQVLTEQRIETMNRLADRLGLTKKSIGEPYDWRRLIRDLTDVARANNFSKEVLEISKQRSWESFERMLPPVQPTDPVTWHNRLLSLLDQTAEALDAHEADTTKVTRETAESLRILQNQLKWREELYWHEWVKIGKMSVAAKSRDLMEPLRDFALTHDEHRQFREDIQAFIFMVFDITMDALGEFEQYKKKRGLIDYTDMETYVSTLLRNPTVQDTLRREIDLLLVDEFQDTSPIQLDIFLQLSRLAKHSIWVGDPKQSIYGFRGADPALMRAIIDATGGVQDENILKKSWRSRPDIVHAVNAIFTKTFADVPPEQVALEPAYREKEQLPAPNAIIHWHFRSELDERKTPGSPWMENCIADQIRITLDRGIPVFNKKRDQTRPVRPGDIAVLCRSNKACQGIAEALHRAGLKASISRSGLLDTAEGRLAVACMKYLLMSSDRLSAAEIALITESSTLAELADPSPDKMPPEAGEYLHRLNELRPRTADLSASEILNLLLEELDLRRIVVRLGNPDQRLDNLDLLRHYAVDYESACNRLHSAASLGGFLLWLSQLADADRDHQGSGDSPDAVNVLTYHRSKGLEYPVTICYNLDQPLKEQVWGINLVPETDTPDLDNILGNRWLRFWVNPYADQLKGTRLEETLSLSEASIQATRIALEEEARLLYVGLTRARDYLIFPTNPKPAKWLNRVFNHGDENIPTLDPYADETPFYWNGQVIYCDNEPLIKPRDFPEALPDMADIPFHAQRSGRSPVPRQSLMIDPVQEMPPGFKGGMGDPEPFAAWIEFKGEYTPDLGKALQAVMMADRLSLPATARIETARRQVAIHRLQEVITAEALLKQSEAFHQFVQKRLAPARLQTSFPLEGWIGNRQVRLVADLYWDKPESAGVFQFAGFAEGMKKWKQAAQALTPPMGWMHHLLKHSQPTTAFSYWVVFPVEGQVVEVLV
jgi:ATP-dependent exoDNAse (exonuclease V) beta subunit